MLHPKLNCIAHNLELSLMDAIMKDIPNMQTSDEKYSQDKKAAEINL